MTTKRGRLLAHLTYANLVSTAALVVALGAGTAYAANTIGTDDVIDGSLQHVDLHADAVASDTIVDGSVGHADLGATAVGGDRVADGSLTLLDMSGVDVATTVSVPKLKPGKCQTTTIGVAGARPGQLTVISPLDKLKKGVVLAAQRIPANDQLEVGACNAGTRPTRAAAVRVRVVTFD